MNFSKLPFDMFITQDKEDKTEVDDLLYQSEENKEGEENVNISDSFIEEIDSCQNDISLNENELPDMQHISAGGTDCDVPGISLNKITSQLEQLSRSIGNMTPEQYDAISGKQMDSPETYRIPRGLLNELRSFIRDIGYIGGDEENIIAPDTGDKQTATDSEMPEIRPGDGISEGCTITSEMLSEESEHCTPEIRALMSGDVGNKNSQTQYSDVATLESPQRDADTVEISESEPETFRPPVQENGSEWLPEEVTGDIPGNDTSPVHIGPGDFPDVLKNTLTASMEKFINTHAGIRCLLISTADGFEVASFQLFPHEFHIRKLSALSSSMSGISAAMLREVGPGEQDIVFIESTSNIIFFKKLAVNQQDISLTIVATKNETIGQLFWYVRRLSDDISEIFDNYN